MRFVARRRLILAAVGAAVTLVAGRDAAQGQGAGRPTAPNTYRPTPEEEAQVARWPDCSGTIVLRRLYTVALKPAATADSVRALFRALHAEPVASYLGGTVYLLRVPDPGATPADVVRVRQAMMRSSIVETVVPFLRDPAPAAWRPRSPARD